MFVHIFFIVKVYSNCVRKAIEYPTMFDDNLQLMARFTDVLFNRSLEVTNALYKMRVAVFLQLKIVKICVTVPQYEEIFGHIERTRSIYLIYLWGLQTFL